MARSPGRRGSSRSPSPTAAPLHAVERRLDDVQQDVATIGVSIQQLRDDIRTGFSEIRAEVRGGLVEMRDGMAEMRGGLVEMRDGMAEMRGGFVEMRDGMAEMRGGLVEMRDGMAEMRGGLVEIRGGLAEMRSGFAAVDRRFDTVEQRLDALTDVVHRIYTEHGQRLKDLEDHFTNHSAA